jgi:hypothetical protein
MLPVGVKVCAQAVGNMINDANTTRKRIRAARKPHDILERTDHMTISLGAGFNHQRCGERKGSCGTG